MCYQNSPKVGASWQQGGRVDILRWLTALQKACIATGIPNLTASEDFMTTGFPNGMPITCDFALAIKSNGSVYLSVDFGQTWVVLYDPANTFGIPIGTMAWFAGSVAGLPSGWLIADGQAVSRATYADLFALIGTTYGAGDGTTTFNLPDLRGRTEIGVNNSGLPNGANGALSTRNRAASGGSETHTLVEAELAAHTHTSRAGSSSFYTPSSTTSFARVQGQVTGATGGGASHNNLQPSIALYKIIKT